MKIKCISKEILQDRDNPKQYYFKDKVYEVEEERGKELIKTGYFVEVEKKKKTVEKAVEKPMENDRFSTTNT